MEPGEIVTYGEDVLRARADEVTDFESEARGLIPEMYEIMARSRGLGLAAPQIGISKRIFTYDVGDGPHALVNPRIIRATGEEVGVEGCLSIPGLQGEVPRAARVTITGLNEEGRKVRIRAEGMLARVFQHEMDHLDGALFIDRADPETLETVPVSQPGEAEDELEGGLRRDK